MDACQVATGRAPYAQLSCAAHPSMHAAELARGCPVRREEAARAAKFHFRTRRARVQSMSLICPALCLSVTVG